MLTADKDYTYRNKMLRIFMDKGLSQNTRTLITSKFRHLQEGEKEALAQKMVKIMETASKESDIIGMLKETL